MKRRSILLTAWAAFALVTSARRLAAADQWKFWVATETRFVLLDARNKKEIPSPAHPENYGSLVFYNEAGKELPDSPLNADDIHNTVDVPGGEAYTLMVIPAQQKVELPIQLQPVKERGWKGVIRLELTGDPEKVTVKEIQGPKVGTLTIDPKAKKITLAVK